MTIKELKELIKDIPDDNKVSLCVPANLNSIFEGFTVYDISSLSDAPDKDEVFLDAEFIHANSDVERLKELEEER